MNPAHTGKQGGGGVCIALDSIQSTMLYPPTVDGRECFRSPGEHSREDFSVNSVHSLSQATSSPKLPHSPFDETTLHARDAPQRVLSNVLFRGVVTPGLGMKESRAFFVAFSHAAPDRPFPKTICPAQRRPPYLPMRFEHALEPCTKQPRGNQPERRKP